MSIYLLLTLHSFGCIINFTTKWAQKGVINVSELDLKGFQIVHTDEIAKNGLLKEKRIILGLTQQQVAYKDKIKLQQYQRFESGERNLKTASFQ